jgi:hypothetical protein
MSTPSAQDSPLNVSNASTFRCAEGVARRYSAVDRLDGRLSLRAPSFSRTNSPGDLRLPSRGALGHEISPDPGDSGCCRSRPRRLRVSLGARCYGSEMMTTSTMRQSKQRRAKSVFAWLLNGRTVPGIGRFGVPDCQPCRLAMAWQTPFRMP